MPRVKKLKKKRVLEFTKYHREDLLIGFYFSGMGFGDDEDARRTVWFRHRDELLKFWLQSPESLLRVVVKRSDGHIKTRRSSLDVQSFESH